MKKGFVLFFILLLAFILGMAVAIAKTELGNKKAKVDVVKFGKMVDITVLPPEGYKWNEQFPATLKFSICNDVECIFVTEKIKIKKD